jgi:hypothetical protein
VKPTFCRYAVVGAAGILVGLMAGFSTGAFSQTNAGTFNVAANSNLGVTCANALSNADAAANSKTVQCAKDPTTTSTTIASATTADIPATTSTPTVSGGSSPCHLQTTPSGSPQALAFCDPLNEAPANNPPSNRRAGQLNGVLWGTSITGGNDPNDFVPTAPAPAACGGGNVNYPNTIQMCAGQLNETIDDGEGVYSQAEYPRQPFNFAGRTGTIVFDVSNTSQGSHAAWPELWVTDQPIPDPFTFEGGNADNPRNGFGLSFDSGAYVGEASIVKNYVERHRGVGRRPAEPLSGAGLGQRDRRVRHQPVQWWMERGHRPPRPD